ncbi:MAG: hypothetical protein Q9164_002562 [Protoblastenia rupestris]
MAQISTLTETKFLPHYEKSGTGEHEGLIFEGPTSLPLRGVNIGQLLDEQRGQYAAKVAAVSRWQGISLTYQTLHSSSRDIAQSLLIHGVRPKDRVVVLAGNTIQFAQLFFAVGGIGATFAIINPTFTAEEVVTAVDFLDPVAIFVADRIGYRKNTSLLTELTKRREHVSLIVQLVTVKKASANVLTWDEFLQKKPSDVQSTLLAQYWAQGDLNDILCIQFTSGTTGPRKAAMLSYGNLLNNALLVGQRLDLTSDDVVCCCSPVFHCFGLVCGVLSAIMYGGTAVLPSDIFVADASLQALSEERCTVIHAVPAMFQALLDHPDTKKHSPKICLRTGIIAGSSLSRTLLSRLSAEFGFRGLAYGYVGTVMPHTSAKVVDSDLKTLPPGSSGELLVSGYSVFQGYYKNPDKSEEALVRDSQGRQWLRTGDLGIITTAGRCTIIGRVKDMIKRGGENIFPGDIEKVLELHPEIAAAAVVGIPDTYWGEIVGAFIHRATNSKPETGIGKKDLKIWLRNRIAPHKVPEHFFWIGEGAGIPDKLPVNATGKIVKMELRAIASGLVQRNVSP